MSKYEEPFEDTLTVFTTKLIDSGLDNIINVRILAQNDLKQIFKVVKSNELLKHIGGDDIIILVNELIFDQLTELQKVMVVDEAITYIGYDYDKDKVFIAKPDVTTFSLFLLKYQYADYEVLRESIKTLFNAEQDKEV